jgi:integrase
MTGRGYIKKRGDTWMIQVSAGTDPETGKRRRITRTIGGSKRQAQSELTRLQRETDQGALPLSVRLSVGEYLDSWLEDVVLHRNRRRTYESYRTIVEQHLKLHIGALPLQSLEAMHIQKMLGAIRRLNRSESTLQRIFTVLRKALTDAERTGLVNKLATRNVEPPRPAKYKVDLPDLEAFKSVIELARRNSRGAVMEFMAHTGLRRGEALALKWSEIDISNSRAQILKSAQRIRGGGIILVEPKSASGKRAVSLNADAIAILEQQKVRQAEEHLKAGPAYSGSNFVFATELGLILDPDNLSHRFKKIAREAGFPALRLHDLRHFHAYALALGGAHPKVIQVQLGHASAAFTMQVYTHVDASLQASAVGKTAGLLG